MPRDTFFNLPVKKKERVIEAAIDEFARHSFHKARITAIADKAKIAKGSMYQYFEGKKDIFKYIVELTVEKKIKYINQEMIINKHKYNFFQLLREVYLSGFRFAKENPRLVIIGNMLVSNNKLFQEIYGEHKEKSLDFFKKLLEQGIEDGDLDPAIDPVLISKFLTTLNYSLVDFIYEDNEINLNDIEIIDKMLYFIENGIKNRE